MDLCQKDKDLLNTVAQYLNTAKPLLDNGTDKPKIKKLIMASEDHLDEVGADLIKLDEMIGKLAVTLNELKERHARIIVKTAIVADPVTGRIKAKDTYDQLARRHKKFSKKLEYYCHLYMTLHHQVESQRLANEMKEEGYDGFDDLFVDDEKMLERKAIRAGPHVNRMLRGFVNKS